MKKNLLYFVLIAGLALGTSCKKDDKNENDAVGQDLPSAEAKNVLKSSSQEIQNDLSELINSEGVDAIVTLSNYFGEDDFSEDNLRTMKNTDFRRKAKAKAEAFNKYFSPYTKSLHTKSTKNLNEVKGVYNWNKETQSWDSVGASDKFILNFPAPESNPTNNAVLTWSEYQTQEFTDNDGYTYVNPTKLVLDLKIDGVKYASVDFTASYKNGEMPLKVNYSLYLKPYTSTFAFDNNDAEVNLTSSMSKDGRGDFFTVSGKSTFTDASQEELAKAEGSIRYNELAFTANADVQGAENDDNRDELHLLNTYFKGSFRTHSTNRLIGNIYFAGEEYPEAHIKYADGTSETLESYMSPLLDELEGFFTESEVARVKNKVKAKFKVNS